MNMKINQRQDEIVRTLRRNGTLTISEISQHVDVSRRTIIRDIQALRDAGFIINSDPGPGGGIQLDPQSIQTNAQLSVNEIFALLISVASIRAMGAYPFAGLADSALSKIEKSLPPDRIYDLRRFLKCLYVGTLSPQVDISTMGEMDPNLLPVFEMAFLNKLHLEFNYQDAKGVKSQRLVEPQALLIPPPLWYLVAWDPSREDFRHFRMDRISQPQALPETRFKRRTVTFETGIYPVNNYSQ